LGNALPSGQALPVCPAQPRPGGRIELTSLPGKQRGRLCHSPRNGGGAGGRLGGGPRDYAVVLATRTPEVTPRPGRPGATHGQRGRPRCRWARRQSPPGPGAPRPPPAAGPRARRGGPGLGRGGRAAGPGTPAAPPPGTGGALGGAGAAARPSRGEVLV